MELSVIFFFVIERLEILISILFPLRKTEYNEKLFLISLVDNKETVFGDLKS